MTRGQHARKHGVTMNTNDFMLSRGLRINVLYAVTEHIGEWYRVYGPGLKTDYYWVHESDLNFEGPPCMFNKEA